MKGMKVLGCAGALALLVAAPGVSAQEEGEAMKSILGSIGIIPKEKPPIVYNERAPLVLPPKMELRAPLQGSSVEARDPNWPKDPDAAARRKAAAEARLPYHQSEAAQKGDARRLSIDEIRAGRNPNNYATAPETINRQADKSTLTPDELRSFGKNDSEVKLSGDGLERRYLSDPPAGLLKAAGGAPLRASADPEPLGDPDSPYAFQREQAKR